MLNLRKIIYVCILLIITLVLLIPSGYLFSLEKIRLIHADRLQNITREGNQFKKMTGNILIKRGTSTLRSDIAYYRDQNEKMEFLHNVKVNDEKNYLTCDSLIFLNREDLLIALGNPVLESDTSTLKADVIRYNLKTKTAFAHGKINLENGEKEITGDSAVYFTNDKQVFIYGEAAIEDSSQHTTLASRKIHYDVRSKLLSATLSPVFTKRDTSDSVLFVVTADSIVGDEANNMFSGYSNVTVTRQEMKAVCEKIVYSEKDSNAVLYENPQIYYKNQNLKGKEILLNFNRGRLSRLFIDENAYATSKTTAYDLIVMEDTLKKAKREVFDWLSGKSLEIFFHGGEIDSMVLGTMASSDYNVLDDDSVHQGLNSTSGDSIFMSFENEEISLIKIKGGCLGKFTPSVNNKDVDTVIVYRAEEIDYWMKKQFTRLAVKAQVDYADASLSAGKIEVKWEENMLYAEPIGYNPVEDSLYTDLPTLKQRGREPFSGEWMAYNMKTKRGKIREGRTKLEDGYYMGEDINKQENDVFYVRNGIYTTCDLDSAPHYYFKSKKMKLIKKDKIIARPIILYIADIPLFGLPWGVFPDKSGKRHSGWLMPSYGENAQGGYLKGLGYYFAPSDYWDAKLTLDFYDKVGIVSQYALNYALRYYLRGGISGSYTYDFLSWKPNRRWNLNVRHNQTLSQSSRLNISANFVSDEKYLQDIGVDRKTRLTQQMVSNATYSKSWQGTPFSLSLNARQVQNLQTGRLIAELPETTGKQVMHISRTLPSLRITMREKTLVPQSFLKKNKDSWYSKIYISGSSNFTRSQKLYYKSEAVDDSLIWNYHDDRDKVLRNSLSLSQSHSFFGWLALRHSMSLKNDWIFKYTIPREDSGGTVIYEGSRISSEEISKPKTRITGNYSLNAQTKLYGLFPVSLGPLMAIRHVVTPRINYSLTPDFSKPLFGMDLGYFYHGFDSTGQKIEYDYFSGSSVGATSRTLRQEIRFSLGNLFQIKTIRDGKEQKRDLITINSSSAYDFSADSLKLKPVSTSVRTSLTRKFALQLSMSHDFYKYTTKRINQWNDKWKGIPVPRMTSMSASTGFRLSPMNFRKGKEEQTSPGADTTVTDSILLPQIPQKSPVLSGLPEIKGETGQLWSLNVSLRYSLQGQTPENRKETFYMNTNLTLKLTRNWKIGYYARFNLINKRLESQDFRIYRDLHCWELTFNWTPTGYGRQYLFTINVKSPNLKDLKYEERGGRRARFGF